jgi:hypothetical protein
MDLTVNDSKTSLSVNNIFEQPWWLDAVAPGHWKEIWVEENGEILARWPVVEKNNHIDMPQLTLTLGFWLSDHIVKSDTHYIKRKRVINLLLEQLPVNKSISINLSPEVEYFMPLCWKGFIIHPRISYRFNDLSNLDAIYGGFTKNLRQTIRSAGNKVTIKAIDDIEILTTLLDKTFRRQNLKNPWSKELVRNIYAACKKHNACHLIYAQDKDGNIHSGNLFVYDEKVCYDLISGSDPVYNNSGARTLVAWEGIKFASKVSQIFDFEGSQVEGIEHYFRQFGAKPVVFYHILKQNIWKRTWLDIAELMKHVVKKLIFYNHWRK